MPTSLGLLLIAAFVVATVAIADDAPPKARLRRPIALALLDDGAMTPRPVVSDGQVVVRQLMRVTMSCDHRVVDGATGAKFLQTLKKILENPLYLLA